jgi:hypothetical protein
MHRLVRILLAVAGTVLATVALAPLSALAAGDDMASPDVLQFNTAFANVSPFIGPAGTIRGVEAAPLPWAIRAIDGNLDANGMLTVAVNHLVLANDPAVPANLRGTNPVPFFAAIVSCNSAAGGKVVVSNVTSANFKATMPGGDAVIHQKLTLPTPCAAPDVFITSPNGGVWFAVTGSTTTNRAESDVLQFETAFANRSPFIGPAGAIVGVNAAPLPWAVRSEHGKLDASGRLDVDVDGLVLANDPAVPANLRGTNPVPMFAAVVTCRTNVNGKVGVIRVTSANVPASPQGNAEIHTKLTLPSPCATPYVFITSPNGGVWFSVTGR